ncbi:hypothetical protein NXX03_22745 [Bacteroides thetaiotaomicron]|nr:hypothetical protein [Bacteroides thetaiotaomicron]
MRRYRWGVADRLLSVEDSRRGETRYSYTPTGQLDRAEYPDGREQWRKSDPVGNLYPDPDMKLRRYLSGGRLEQDGEWHCEYDADGNLTERYLGTGKWLDGKKDRWRYRWNADGSLAKVVRPDKREVEFTYDALGRRLSKSFGTTVTRWIWNGNVPLHQWKQRREYSVMEDRWNTDTERRDMTVWLFDEGSFVPMAMIKEGRSYSILTDQLGTPTEAYDAEGNEVWSRVLDMDGNVIEETGNKGMVPFLFQGQYYDCETGLAYNRFRYYSPLMGMYVSQDPIGLGGGILNLYGYVSDTNISCDYFGLYLLIPNAPTYSGVYHIELPNGDGYVGSAINIRERLESNNHKTAKQMIETGEYTITFYEVDMGTATTRKEQNHVLRHFEQQIMDVSPHNQNRSRAEAKEKFTIRVNEITKLNARLTGSTDEIKQKKTSYGKG